METNFGAGANPNAVSGFVAAWRDWARELVAVSLLGLAAVGAGWAAYQSALWNGEQQFSLHESAAVQRRATFLENRANQARAVDVGMFTAYLEALSGGDTVLSNFMFARFRPEMKRAVEAWLATKPLKNPNAPSTPFAMKEYQLADVQEARRLEAQGDRLYQNAQFSNRTSDTYVLITVPLATVSLLSGLATKLRSEGMRTAFVAMAFVVFAGAAVALALMPVR